MRGGSGQQQRDQNHPSITTSASTLRQWDSVPVRTALDKQMTSHAEAYTGYSMLTRRTAIASLAAPLLAAQSRNSVERWGTLDVNLEGPRDGNPFVDVRVSAEFRH